MSNIITSSNASTAVIIASLTCLFFAVTATALSLRAVRLLSRRVDACEESISDMDDEIRDLSPDQEPPALGKE